MRKIMENRTVNKTIVTILRVTIGWHFLYEGWVKLSAEHWTAESYLSNTYGFLSGFYHWLAASPTMLQVVNFMNVWGLILIGLGLFTGLFSRLASFFGTLLLVLYYFAYPPFGVSLLGGDGTLYIVDKIFLEAVALVFLFFYAEKGYGLDEFLKLWKDLGIKLWKPVAPEATTEAPSEVNTRREALKNLVTLPVLGFLGWSAHRSNQIYNVDVMSGATIQVNQVALSQLKGELPKGKIGGLEISRLIMGSNIIGGWAHSRDLIYTSSLMKAYNTEKKVFETLMLGEQAGINAINIAYQQIPIMVKYKKITGSKIKIITQIGVDEKNKDDIYADVTQAVDSGMDMIQLQGNWCDWLVRDGKFDVIAGLMDRIRSHGSIAGMGAHTIDSLILCDEKGIFPDFYMKTMHHDNYWSAHPRENRKPFEVDGKYSRDHNQFHDNCFCPFPDRTVEFVNRAKLPVIGFKVLAAGAIYPKDGFNWAFENGADIICVGMFDFQLVDDVNICIDTLQNLKNRKREWYA